MSEGPERVEEPRAPGEAEPAFVWGEGEMPPELRRFNLGAFVFPLLWAFLHRMWGWVLFFLASTIGGNVIVRWAFPSPARIAGVRPSGPSLTSTPVLVYLAWVAAHAALALWFGAHADRLLWQAGTRGDKNRPTYPTFRSEANYLNDQAGCAKWALVLLVYEGLFLAYVAFRPGASGPARTVANALILATYAAALVWWWLDRRRVPAP